MSLYFRYSGFPLWQYVISFFPGAGNVHFSFRNTIYQNNSCVALEDIGEGDKALLCKTNLTDCCRTSGNSAALGNWFFPNGTRVPSLSYRWDFYRARGQKLVCMSRRRGGVEGIYSCEIPDSMNVNRTLYIGVYTASRGKPQMHWLCMILFSASSLHKIMPAYPISSIRHRSYYSRVAFTLLGSWLIATMAE